jgi:hypothetical protein
MGTNSRGGRVQLIGPMGHFCVPLLQVFRSGKNGGKSAEEGMGQWTRGSRRGLAGRFTQAGQRQPRRRMGARICEIELSGASTSES